MDYYEEIASRNIPALPDTREEMLGILRHEYLGAWPDDVRSSFKVIETNEDVFGGKALSRRVEISLSRNDTVLKYPVLLIIPALKNAPEKGYPVFIHLNFNDEPAGGIGEEIIDNGYALVQINYNDVEPDISSNEAKNVQKLMPEGSKDRWGKIGVWAYGASKAADYLETCSEIDTGRMAVVGHSRLGLASAWCGANDERFSLTVLNNNGALYRGTECETYRDLAREYTRYWFAEKAFENDRDAEALPFDMHFLHAAIAPRNLYIAAASADRWAAPHSMLLSALAAGPAYEKCGLKGLVIPEGTVENDHMYHEGNIAFHLRTGTHYLGRTDWNGFMSYRENKNI